MITVTNFRNNGMECPPVTSEEAASKALESLVVFELGFGGHVTGLSRTRVAVNTNILGCKDRTVFEGPAEEMEFIVRVATYHATITSEKEIRSALIENAAEFLNDLPRNIGGVPLYISMMTPFLVGNPSAKVALLFAAGITDPEVVKNIVPISLNDLFAAVVLHRETGVPLPEIVKEMRLSGSSKPSSIFN